MGTANENYKVITFQSSLLREGNGLLIKFTTALNRLAFYAQRNIIILFIFMIRRRKQFLVEELSGTLAVTMHT